MAICRICHRALTDPESIKAGIGPFCAKKEGVEKKSDAEQCLKSGTLNVYAPRPLDPVLSNKIYAKLAVKKCKHCQTELPSQILHYEHDSGWIIPGMEKKQWLIIIYPHCDYQWSLWKLGFDKETVI